MYRFVRFRSIIFCLLIPPIILLTSIYYDDLQQKSINGKSASLPFDAKAKTPNKNKPLESSTKVINRTEIIYYREFVEKKNSEQFIYNKHLFSSETTRYILLVQVHTRVAYLKKFIEMLRDVEMINQTLVIFSHDFVDPAINLLIINITYAPVKFFFRIYDGEFEIYFLGDSNILSLFTTTLSR
jgi:hypothetical protein